MRTLPHLLSLAALLLAPAAHAEEVRGAADTRVATDTRRPEEVIVYGDPYARWDGTRWYVDTQIGMPVPYPLFAKNNLEFEAMAVQLRFVLACEKTWRRSRSRHEVDCGIEEIAIQGAPWRRKEPNAQVVLDELDAKLTGARVQLLVANDGRLVNIGLEGLEGDNDREKAIREQARMLLVRGMIGFHMKLPPRNQIRQGQWLEYDSRLFAMPVTPDGHRRDAGTGPGGAGGQSSSPGAARAAVVVNTLGGSYVLHQLDKYKGHLVVQSVGEGTILVGDEDTGNESFFKIKLDGVAIYDEGTGIMTERVWSMRGRSTAGSALSDGRADAFYFHNGRIRMLGTDERVEVGQSRLVSRPGEPTAGLPPWMPLD